MTAFTSAGGGLLLFDPEQRGRLRRKGKRRYLAALHCRSARPGSNSGVSTLLLLRDGEYFEKDRERARPHRSSALQVSEWRAELPRGSCPSQVLERTAPLQRGSRISALQCAEVQKGGATGRRFVCRAFAPPPPIAPSKARSAPSSDMRRSRSVHISAAGQDCNPGGLRPGSSRS